MADSLALLDQALELGQQELDRLSTGEVDDLDQLAEERARLINQAWKVRRSGQEQDLKTKLVQMQSLQGELTQEAMRLRENLRSKLKDSKQQTTRFSGYARVAKPKPVGSRFLSAKG